jgi:hypothetical protein
MAPDFWYLLIHVGLGLVGYRQFTFDNEGGLLAVAAGVAVHGYWAWTVHLRAWPLMRQQMAEAPDTAASDALWRGYRRRLLRSSLIRVGLYSLVTLGIAALVRGGAEA